MAQPATETNLREALTYEPVELDFGTSGLRGKVVDMTDLECYINTTGFLRYLLDSGNITAGAIISLAGDLRVSTPRIMRAVAAAITDSGCTVENAGLVPTPAVAFWAQEHDQASIMVTGSHIPDDRNGIKFFKRGGEVLKPDEAAIKQAVAAVRQELYAQPVDASGFLPDGSRHNLPELPAVNQDAEALFLKRYTDCFPADTLAGRRVIVYQQSAVGRDLLVTLLERLGATVAAVDRSESFIPIDTENVTPDNRAYFKGLATRYPDNFAIVSTDGDSDRPFLVDETGTFQRGDVLGIVVSDFIGMEDVAVPVSVNDAVDMAMAGRGVQVRHTRIGSPYVIEAMQQAVASGALRVGGWEVNGGYLLGCDVSLDGRTMKSLPTRDAFLPIIAVLTRAVRGGKTVSELFSELPSRYTQAGLIDNFPVEASRAILAAYPADTPEARVALQGVFTAADGFGNIERIDTTDGIRLTFLSGDVAHVRPSGNAPQMRIYSVAGSQERADAIVARGLAEPDGLLRRLQVLAGH